MGTRGIWGFVVDGEKKFGYNHWDSYPDGLGADLAKALQTYPGTLDELKADARKLQLVNEDEKPTAEQMEALKPYADLGVSTQSLEDWYCLLRNTQGNLTNTLKAGYMAENFAFGYDALFCEWGYVVDLDAEKFVVYKGFTQAPVPEGLWADTDEKGTADHQGYTSIRPFAEFDLAEILTGGELVVAKVEAVGSEDNDDD